MGGMMGGRRLNTIDMIFHDGFGCFSDTAQPQPQNLKIDYDVWSLFSRKAPSKAYLLWSWSFEPILRHVMSLNGFLFETNPGKDIGRFLKFAGWQTSTYFFSEIFILRLHSFTLRRPALVGKRSQMGCGQL